MVRTTGVSFSKIWKESTEQEKVIMTMSIIILVVGIATLIYSRLIKKDTAQILNECDMMLASLPS